MKKNIKPNLVYISALRSRATINSSSPFKNIQAAFNWTDMAYPIEHTHDHWEVLIVLYGKLKHTLNGKTNILSRGDACVIRPNDKHRLDQVSSIDKHQIINFTFTSELCKKMISLYTDYEDLTLSNTDLSFTLSNGFLNALTDKVLLIQNMAKEEYEKNTILLINSLLLHYFEFSLNNNSAYPEWLNSFLRYINSPTHFHENIQTLAKQTPYTPSSLTRVFKKYLGIPIITYLQQIKMTYAKRLLRTTSLTIIEISMELGYESVSTFNHTFKNFFKATPTEYRNSHLIS